MIEGFRTIQYDISEDNRGKGFKLSAFEDFHQDEIYVSRSKRNVIRGMHFQPYPYQQRKAVFVIKGEILGVILDLRRNSPSFCKVHDFRMTDSSGEGVFVPAGCAWGFQTVAEDSILLYSIDGIYNKEYDCGVYYDSIGFDWKAKDPIVSERDKRLPSLKDVIDKNQFGDVF